MKTASLCSFYLSMLFTWHRESPMRLEAHAADSLRSGPHGSFFLKQQHFTHSAKSVVADLNDEASTGWTGSWALAPVHGGVTFHELCTLKQKVLLKDPPRIPQVSDQQLSISNYRSMGFPKMLSRKRGHSLHPPRALQTHDPKPKDKYRFPQGEQQPFLLCPHSFIDEPVFGHDADRQCVQHAGLVSKAAVYSPARTHQGLFLGLGDSLPAGGLTGCLRSALPPAFSHHPVDTVPTSGSLDQNKEGKILTGVPTTHFSQAPRHSRANASGNTIIL